MATASARLLASPPPKAEFLRPRHEVGNVALVLGTHAGLVACFWLAYQVLPLVLYVPLSMVACVIHQRAMSEWIHEAAHFNLLRTKRWNDLLGDLLAGIWFALPTASYRATHFQHHARDAFFLPGDRDTVFLLVGSRRELRRAMLRDVLGLTVAAQYLRFRDPSGQPPASAGFLALTALAQVALLATLWWLGRLDAWLLYYLSLVTLYPLMNRVRTYDQHVELDGDTCRMRGSTTARNDGRRRPRATAVRVTAAALPPRAPSLAEPAVARAAGAVHAGRRREPLQSQLRADRRSHVRGAVRAGRRAVDGRRVVGARIARI